MSTVSETTHDGAVAVGAPPAPSADDGLSPAELAAKYGLSVSGARPGLVDYTRQLWGRRHFINEFAKATYRGAVHARPGSASSGRS